MSCPLKIEGMPTLWDRLPEKVKKKLYGRQIMVKSDKVPENEAREKEKEVEIKEVQDINIDIHT